MRAWPRCLSEPVACLIGWASAPDGRGEWDAGLAMNDLVITSPANPRLRDVVALRRRRVRDELRLSLVEGREELTLALDAGARPQALYWCPELWGPQDHADLVDRVRAAGGQCVRLGRAAFEKVAYRQGPDGFLAVLPAPSRHLVELDPYRTDLPSYDADPRRPDLRRQGSTAPLVLLCQGVEKPGNLGAMLRTADAAGVAAVLAADPVTDWGHPNLVRASKGTVYSVPVAADTGPACLDWLAAHAIPIVALTPAGEVDYAEVDYTGPIALAVGAEKTGLTDVVLAAAAQCVVIPMAGRADSLNVATSAAVVLYEAVRQRRR